MTNSIFCKEVAPLIKQIEASGLSVEVFMDSFLDLLRFQKGIKVEQGEDVQATLDNVPRHKREDFLRFLRKEVSRYELQNPQ